MACILLLSTLLLFFQNCEDHSSNIAGTNEDSLNYRKTIALDISSDTKLLLKRLTGILLPEDDEFFIEVNNLVQNNMYEEATQKITERDEFYNITIRDFASKMSVASEVTTAPLSDFVATIIGIARDDINAQKMLTGSFFYKGKKQTGIRENVINDIVKSNNHYDDLDKLSVNLRLSLEKIDNQKVLSNNKMIDLEDAAGVLTSRAFMMAHAYEGTNRRVIEYSMSQFLCRPITEWANGQLSDAFVGRDIGRSPKVEYDSKCKSCHAPMDSFRPATAYFDFTFPNPKLKTGFINYKNKTTRDPNPEKPTQLSIVVAPEEQLVSSKFRRSKSTFEFGFVVKNNQWVNLLIESGKFEWSSAGAQGEGMKAFGTALSESNLFSECMAERAFKSVCKRHPTEGEASVIRAIGEEFRSSNYSLKKLFEIVALTPNCLGIQ